MFNYVGNWVVKDGELVGISPSDSGRLDRILGRFEKSNPLHYSHGPTGVPVRFVFRPYHKTTFGPNCAKFILEHLLALNEREVSDE